MKNMFKGATLLSVDEAKQVFKPIRVLDEYRYWWLRSPGCYKNAVGYVNLEGEVWPSGDLVKSSFDIRPALILNRTLGVKEGDRFKTGGYVFDVVCEGKYALCAISIGKSAFRKDWMAEDANDYEVSDVKKVVDGWFKSQHWSEIEVIKKAQKVLKSHREGMDLILGAGLIPDGTISRNRDRLRGLFDSDIYGLSHGRLYGILSSSESGGCDEYMLKMSPALKLASDLPETDLIRVGKFKFFVIGKYAVASEDTVVLSVNKKEPYGYGRDDQVVIDDWFEREIRGKNICLETRR